MSIKYSVSARKNLQRPEDPEMYYGVSQIREVIDMDRICRELAYATSLTEGDVYNVIRNLPHKIKEHVEDGDMVDLGHLGKFSYNISSAGSPTRAGYTHNLIRKVRFQFTPGKLLTEAISKLQFEEVVTIKDKQEAMRKAKQG